MREPGERRQKVLRAEGWSYSLEKRQTRGQGEETRGDGIRDSIAVLNRGYRRVIKQIPVFSVLFFPVVSLSECLISSQGFRLTPPVSVCTH